MATDTRALLMSLPPSDPDAARLPSATRPNAEMRGVLLVIAAAAPAQRRQ